MILNSAQTDYLSYEVKPNNRISGLASYSTLRPLVYRDCSVVLICYSSGGLDGVKSWVDEVRKSTNAPLVLVNTKNDQEEERDMEKACEVCESIGAANWETSSAKTGENIQLVFELCTLAANVVCKAIRGDRKEKMKRPNTLKFSSVKDPVSKTSNLSEGDSNEDFHVYENPDELTLPKLTKKGVPNCFPMDTQAKCNGQDIIFSNVNSDRNPVESEKFGGRGEFSSVSRQSQLSDTQNPWLRTSDESLFTSQSRKSFIMFNNCVKSPSPTPSITKAVPMRPHSSQSAQIRPSRLYRHSANRLSMHTKLKAVPIPLSPNCDINQNRDKYQYSDTSSILSPTDSTVSSIISSHLSMPPFRNSKYLVLPSPSPSSSSNAYQPFSPTSFQSRMSSDRESVSSQSVADSVNTSFSDNCHRTNHLRPFKNKNLNDRYRVDVFKDHIEEVEETCEVVSSGCSIFPPRPKSQLCDKSSKLRSVNAPSSSRMNKKNPAKERCSLM